MKKYFFFLFVLLFTIFNSGCLNQNANEKQEINIVLSNYSSSDVKALVKLSYGEPVKFLAYNITIRGNELETISLRNLSNPCIINITIEKLKYFQDELLITTRGHTYIFGIYYDKIILFPSPTP